MVGYSTSTSFNYLQDLKKYIRMSLADLDFFLEILFERVKMKKGEYKMVYL